MNMNMWIVNTNMWIFSEYKNLNIWKFEIWIWRWIGEKPQRKDESDSIEDDSDPKGLSATLLTPSIWADEVKNEHFFPKAREVFRGLRQPTRRDHWHYINVRCLPLLSQGIFSSEDNVRIMCCDYMISSECLNSLMFEYLWIFEYEYEYEYEYDKYLDIDSYIFEYLNIWIA